MNADLDIIIHLIKNLPEKRDSRYSKFIQDKFVDDKLTLLDYYSGKLKEICCCSEDKYKICILENNHEIYFNTDADNIPVPAGLWMDWWEEDYQKYFGISSNKYETLDKKDRALLECKLQLHKNYPRIEYFYLYADFYFPIEYDMWWWNENIDMSEKQGINAEEYWKKKFFEKKSLKKDEIIKYKLEKALDIICPLYKAGLITGAIIVGSVAKGTAKKESDIDIILTNPIFINAADFPPSPTILPFDPSEEELELDNLRLQIVDVLKNIGITFKEITLKDVNLWYQFYKDEIFHLMTAKNKDEAIRDEEHIEITVDLC